MVNTNEFRNNFNQTADSENIPKIPKELGEEIVFPTGILNALLQQAELPEDLQRLIEFIHERVCEVILGPDITQVFGENNRFIWKYAENPETREAVAKYVERTAKGFDVITAFFDAEGKATGHFLGKELLVLRTAVLALGDILKALKTNYNTSTIHYGIIGNGDVAKNLAELTLAMNPDNTVTIVPPRDKDPEWFSELKAKHPDRFFTQSLDDLNRTGWEKPVNVVSAPTLGHNIVTNIENSNGNPVRVIAPVSGDKTPPLFNPLEKVLAGLNNALVLYPEGEYTTHSTEALNRNLGADKRVCHGNLPNDFWKINHSTSGSDKELGSVAVMRAGNSGTDSLVLEAVRNIKVTKSV